MSGVVPEQFIRTVRAIVQQEMQKNSRLSVSSIEGKGGNTTISSWGDIHIRTMSGFKAYYNGVELGTTADSGIYMRKDAGAGDQTQNNQILMAANLIMRSNTQIELNAIDNVKTAELSSVSAVVELVDYYGTQITPYNYGATSPGNFYIGHSNAAPAGDGIKMTESYMSITPVADDLRIYGNVNMESFGISFLAAPTLVGDAARYKDAIMVCTSATRPASPTEGMHIYETDTDKDYKCTVGGATPTWAEITGGAYLLADGTTALTGNWGVGNYNITGTGDVIPHDSGNHTSGSNTYYWAGVYTNNLYVGNNTTYITKDASDNMEIHLATNKKIEIVVG